MNSELIRKRKHRSTKPFGLRLRDGTCVRVAHPDFMAAPPGSRLVLVLSRSGKEKRLNSADIVAIEEGPLRKIKTSRRKPR